MVFLLQSLSYTLIHQHSCELSDKSRQGFPGWEGALFSSYSSPIRRLGGLHIPEQRCKGGRLLLARPSPFSTLPASHLEFHSTKLCKWQVTQPRPYLFLLWSFVGGQGMVWDRVVHWWQGCVCCCCPKKVMLGGNATVGQWDSGTVAECHRTW